VTTQAQQTSPRALTCAACGAPFSCTGDITCWCAAEPYRLPMPALDSVADCLCPSCLRAKAAAVRDKT
jgi:hypothetical protein